MFKIISKQKVAQDITRLDIESPIIAKKAQAGQFVMVLPEKNAERIPLTIADTDEKKGIITLIFQEVGFTTKRLSKLNKGDSIENILGPLGNPTHIEKFGTVVCIGGGVGVAEVYPVAKALKKAQNRIIGIIGARSKNLIILEEQMKGVCDELFITTDDGSYGQKGFVTDALKNLFSKKIDLVYAIGPVVMMRAVSEVTRSYKIKTMVSLNPIMVDATGMCGSCRVTVGGKTFFGCVDGPEFDGHLVDFEELEKRLNLFKEQEKCLVKQCPRRK